MTNKDIAFKIWITFEVNQSCKVSGYVTENNKLVKSGEQVIEFLRQYDFKLNYNTPPDGRPRRIRKVEKNSIGGPVAHKIFKYKEPSEDDPEAKYTIWRFQ